MKKLFLIWASVLQAVGASVEPGLQWGAYPIDASIPTATNALWQYWDGDRSSNKLRTIVPSRALMSILQAGDNITIATNANGKVVITGEAGGGGSVSVNGSEVETPDFADSATLTWGVVGSTISATVANLTAAALATDSVSADELNAAGVETELEGVLDLQDLQGAVTDAQVPDTITVDLATVATTANAGDSATAFFSSGEIEDARLPSALARDSEITTEMANVVKSSGSSVANDIAVFTDTTRTNIARSTSAARLGDGSSASYTLTIDGSGTDWNLAFTSGGISLDRNLIFGTDNTYDIGASGANRPRNAYVGNTINAGANVVAANSVFATTSLGIASSTRFSAPSDGVMRLINSTSTDFDRLQLGGTTASFPALKRSGTGLQVKLADDSALTGLTAGTLTLTPASADTTAITVSGGSTTGSGTTKAVTFSHTANTSGNIDGVYTFTLTDTASGASTFHSKWLGGSAGTTVLMSLDKSGNLVNGGTLITGGQFTSGGGILANVGNGIGWSDAFIRREAAAVIQMGSDTASPVSQMFKGADGLGTDIFGGTLTIAGGQGTGTGKGGAVKIQTSPSGSTGTSANAYSERAHWIPKAVTLTESTATTVATIAVPSAKFVGGSCTVTVFASDATDHQARTLTFPFSVINKAGTVTAGLGTPVEGVAVSSGTLTATITTVANGNAVDIKVDATSSLTQTTLSATVSIPAINSNDTAAVTEI